MRYIKEILKNNKLWVLAYIGLGIFNAFMANYKTDYFQKVIDGLAAWNTYICRSYNLRSYFAGKLLYELSG